MGRPQRQRLHTCVRFGGCFALQAKVGELCSGDWKFTMWGWRANSWLVAEQKTRKVPSAAGLALRTIPTAHNQVFSEAPE